MTTFELPGSQNFLNAQEIHTRVYLENGYITEDDIDENGLYSDEYTERSEHIVVNIGNKHTAMRLISADKKHGGILSLPTAQHFSIDSDLLLATAKATRLSDIKAREVVEVSGLSAIQSTEGASHAEAFDATRQAYATALRISLDQGHKLWLMNIDEKFKHHLDTILGKGLVTQLGEAGQYMGPPTIPAALNPQEVVLSILTDETSRFKDMNREDITKTLEGVNEKYLSRKLIKQLHAHDIGTEKESLASKAWNNKLAVIYAGIIGYSALRFVPVGFVDQFNGSVSAFAAIDIGTAVTQVASMDMMFKGKNRTIRTLGALGATASFVAPYAYFYANGEDYPWGVNVAAGTFAAIGVGIEVAKSVKDTKIKNTLAESHLHKSED